MESNSVSTQDAITIPTEKRKRSLSGDLPPPPPKVAKTSNHPPINYLARQYDQIIGLVNPDHTLPEILRYIADYDGVLHRHESLAANLGARPLGPILVTRFERLFDGPPRILKCHGKEGTTVSWLDVVDFAKNKPEQFNLEKTRDSVRVCQFYTKQCRVEISEDDFYLVASGMPQRIIPPQPIVEDEEKELGIIELLEQKLSQIYQLADQVSARARQLNHRIKNRKAAIAARREAEAYQQSKEASVAAASPQNGTNMASGANGTPQQQASHSPTSGFIAVNARQPLNSIDQPTNGTNGNAATNGASPPLSRAEWAAKYLPKIDHAALEEEILRTSQPSRPSFGNSSGIRPSSSSYRSNARKSSDFNDLVSSGSSTVPIPHTPSALLPSQPSNYRPSSNSSIPDDGPFKLEMVRRMDRLQRGDRVIPPCDRCRRLHMDCLKNLTACLGCTRKHAKCCWKDVKEDELRDTMPPRPQTKPGEGVTDEELLGEELGEGEADGDGGDESAVADYASSKPADEELYRDREEEIGSERPVAQASVSGSRSRESSVKGIGVGSNGPERLSPKEFMRDETLSSSTNLQIQRAAQLEERKRDFEDAQPSIERKQPMAETL